VLVQVLTAPFALLVDAGTFVYSAVVISGLKVADRPLDVEEAEPLRRRILKGARFVLSDRYLRAGLGCSTTINFFTFMIFALVVLFASRELGLSAGVIGLTFGIGSVGGLLGAAIAPRLSARFGVGPMVVLGSVLFPAPMALLAVAGGDQWFSAAVLATAEFLSAVGVMIFDIPELDPGQRDPGRHAQPGVRRVLDRELRVSSAGGGHRRSPGWRDRAPRDVRARGPRRSVERAVPALVAVPDDSQRGPARVGPLALGRRAPAAVGAAVPTIVGGCANNPPNSPRRCRSSGFATPSGVGCVSPATATSVGRSSAP
jgi:hypothetical protein